MNDKAIGARIRKARKANGLAQKALAKQIGISLSYLSMIESGQRPIAGRLLRNIANELELDSSSLDGQAAAQLHGDLAEVITSLRDTLPADDVESASAEMQKFATQFPQWAKMLIALEQRNKEVRDLSNRLQDQASFDTQLTEIGHQMLQHMTTVRSSASILRESDRLSAEVKTRFGDIVERESQALETMSRDFFERLEVLAKDQGPLSTRRAIDNILHTNLNYFAPLEAMATQINVKSGATFAQLRQQVHLQYRKDIEAIVKGYSTSNNIAIENALYQYFEQYLCAATLMPYGDFASAAEAFGYDIDHLAQHFGASPEQVCHRLTSLRKPGSASIAFAFMKVDAAGNVLKSYSLPEFFVPSTGSTCPKWPLFNKTRLDGETTAQLITHDQNGRFLTISKSTRTVPRGFGGDSKHSAMMLVCRWADSGRTVYQNAAATIQVSAGTSCNICQFPNCAYRLRHSLLS